MKLAKNTRAKLRLSSATERKQVVKAAMLYLDWGLISAKKASMIARNFK